MKKIIKYSKSYNNILSLKSSFLKENKNNLDLVIKSNKLYKKNPKRTKCKNCEKKSLKKFIHNFHIDYYLCNYCGHLNGIYQDTKKFNNNLYSSKNGKNYSFRYDTDYKKRVKNIYLPKAEFLQKVIKKKISLLEFGSGAGHFLKALELKKINAVGFEPNKTLKGIGQKKLKSNKISLSGMDEIYDLCENNKSYNTVALIGTLEHLEKPNLFLDNFNKSSAEYLYISVPIFSLSVFIESSFKNVFPRHLGFGHTHLYTNKSLELMAKRHNLKIVGEWWFGTDFPDLYRSLIVSSNALDKKLFETELDKKFFKVINNLQNELDKQKICSEVHMVFQKKTR